MSVWEIGVIATPTFPVMCKTKAFCLSVLVVSAKVLLRRLEFLVMNILAYDAYVPADVMEAQASKK